MKFKFDKVSLNILSQKDQEELQSSTPVLTYTDSDKQNIHDLLQVEKGEINSFVLNTVSTQYLNYVEPRTHKEALSKPDSQEWIKAENKELEQLHSKMKTFLPLATLPQGKKAVSTKMVYKLKLKDNGTLDKYKARLVARGFTQVYGIDYSDSFSPTPSLTTLKIVLILALHFNLRVYAVDVTGAFLNAVLKEDIIIRFPDGVTVEGCQFAKLLKSLYGLHQAGHDWHEMSDRIIKSFDSRIVQSKTDPCLYFIFTEQLKFFMSVHVDDYTIVCNSHEYYTSLMNHFKKTVEVEEQGTPSIILQMGIEWNPNKDSVSFSQKRQIIKLFNKYANNTQKRYDTPMEAELKLYPGDKDNLPDVPYREVVGALLFIARMSRPDILYAVNVLSRMNNCYTQEHYKYVLRVVIYLYHTADIKLTYKSNPNAPPLTQYCDSSHGDDKSDGTSTCGDITYLFGNAVSWNIMKQKTVSLSTSEAEYKTLTYAFRDGMYFYNILRTEMKLFSWFPITTYIDNIGAGYMAETGQCNKRTKHIHIEYHFVKEKIRDKVHVLERVASEFNVSDIFTKPLPSATFKRMRKSIMQYD